MAWTRDRLKDLLVSLPAADLDAALGSASITLLKDVTGEVRGRGDVHRAVAQAYTLGIKGRILCMSLALSRASSMLLFALKELSQRRMRAACVVAHS